MNVLLFAGVREKAERDVIELPIDPPVPVDQVLRELADRIPQAAALIAVSRLAVDGRYVGSDEVIEADAAEVALIPPVSGG